MKSINQFPLISRSDMKKVKGGGTTTAASCPVLKCIDPDRCPGSSSSACGCNARGACVNI